MGFADETRRPEVPSLKLINVPSHNSAKFFQNFLSRLAGSRTKVLGRHNSRLNRKTLQVFPKFFLSEKTLEYSAIFPALTSSREKFLHLEPFGLFNRDDRGRVLEEGKRVRQESQSEYQKSKILRHRVADYTSNNQYTVPQRRENLKRLMGIVGGDE